MGEFWNTFLARYYRVKTALFYRLIFGRIGARSRIIQPLILAHPECFYIGERVYIRNGARIEAVRERGGRIFNPRVEIGDGTGIEQGLHLVCGEKIVIGKNVAITEYVGIFDIWHAYENVDVPIMGQLLKTSPVIIGDGSFIGMGSVIQPGVTIGKNCMIGANSVVTRSIPDYSVAVGAPARTIKTYDFSTGKWIKV